MKRYRLLLIEDDPDHARQLEELLSRAPARPFSISRVETLGEGVARLRAAAFDLVVLDLTLPDSSGMETLTRTLEAAPDVPVVVVTAVDDRRVAAEAVKAGAQDYVTKGALDSRRVADILYHSIERRRLLTRGEAMAEIGRIVNSSPRVEDTYPQLAEQVRRVIPFDQFGIATWRREGGRIRNVWVDGEGPADPTLDGAPAQVEEAVDRVVRTRVGLRLSLGRSSEPDAAASFAPPGARSALLSPLIATGRVLGVIHFWSRAPEAYSEDDLSVAERVSAHVAGAVANSKLAAALRLHSAALGAAADVVVITDRAGRIEYVNQAFTQVTGYSAEEAIGGNLRLLKSGRQDASFYKNMWETILSGRVWSGVLTNRRKDGSEYPDEMTITPVPGPDGAPTHFIAIKRDITERLRAEETLRLHSAALGAAADVVVITDRAGRIEYVNQAFTQVTGYSAEEAIGGNLRLLKSGRQDASFYKNMWETILSGRVWSGVLTNRRKDGSEYPDEMTITPVPGPDGAPTHFIAIKRDVTERKRYERALKESEARYRDLYDSAPDMFASIDVQTAKIVECNRAYAERLGYAKEEITGRPLFDMYHPDSWAKARATFERFAATGEVRDVELQLRRKDGSALDVTLNASAIRDEQGKIVRSRAVFRDITERLRADREREHRIRVQRDAEVRELERVNEARSEFLAAVSHELKMPLTSILAFADLLARNRDGNLTPRQRQGVDVIRRNGRRLALLINDLLDVSRISSGHLEVHRQVFRASSLFDDVVRGMEPVLSEKAQALDADLPADEVWVNGDRVRLQQVLENLLSNASKYSPPGARIELRTSVEEDRLHVVIADPGVGIPEHAQAKLFTPFYRVRDEATASVPGTGLGLVIVKSIVETHGGDIVVESKPGAGTTVRFWIPGATLGAWVPEARPGETGEQGGR